MSIRKPYFLSESTVQRWMAYSLASAGSDAVAYARSLCDLATDAERRRTLPLARHLESSLRREWAQTVYTDRDGEKWCRARNHRDYGQHRPGAHRVDRKFGGSSVVLACARCRDYGRIESSLQAVEPLPAAPLGTSTSQLPLGDGTIQLTYRNGEQDALLTVRGKDHDLNAEQLRSVALACLRVAERIELNEQGRE